MKGSRSNGLVRLRYPPNYQGTPEAVRYMTYQLGNSPSRCPNLQIGKLSVPMTQYAKWEIELPIDPFCMWVIYQIQMTQFQIDRGISGPGRIKERSKSAYLAFFPNCPDEHLQAG
jgi:hypothetical protein